MSVELQKYDQADEEEFNRKYLAKEKRSEGNRYHCNISYMNNSNVKYNSITYDELGKTRILYLLHVLNLAVMVAIKTNSSSKLVACICKVV